MEDPPNPLCKYKKREIVELEMKVKKLMKKSEKMFAMMMNNRAINRYDMSEHEE